MTDALKDPAKEKAAQAKAAEYCRKFRQGGNSCKGRTCEHRDECADGCAFLIHARGVEAIENG